MPYRTRRPHTLLALFLASTAPLGACRSTEEPTTPAADAAPTRAAATGDARAIELAEATLTRMGGRDAWDATRYIAWSFFGGRRHVWDKRTGRLRLEVDDLVILLDVDDARGSVYRDGTELAGEELEEALARGYAAWVNDSYWMFLPYKLLDPGVHLTWIGATTTADGDPATAIDLTFEDVGLTPENRYRVHVGDVSGLVEQWDFYRDASDTEPALTGPWKGWQVFGGVLLATDHGRGRDWAIEVPDELPDDVFDQP